MPGNTPETQFLVDGVTDQELGLVISAGMRLSVHSPEKCVGEYCVIHNPSEHHMREWPLIWRSDKRAMERTCPHGVGHPDPDGAAADRLLGNSWKSIHGCDGCCGAYALTPGEQDVQDPSEGGHTVLSLEQALLGAESSVVV